MNTVYIVIGAVLAVLVIIFVIHLFKNMSKEPKNNGVVHLHNHTPDAKSRIPK
jgi:hypothetical protein